MKDIIRVVRLQSSTNLNFFIYNNKRIILTQNNSIRNQLPEEFFEVIENEKVVAHAEKDKKPIFYNNEKLSKFKKNEIVRMPSLAPSAFGDELIASLSAKSKQRQNEI